MKATYLEYIDLSIHGGKTRAKITNAQYLSGLDWIKNNSIGILTIRDKGIFFECPFNKKLFISLEDISDTNLEEDEVNISINESGIKYNLKFTHKESAPIINMYNFIQKILPEDKKKDIITVETRTVLETPYIPPIQVSAVEKPKKITERDRLKQLKKDHIPYCPKCHSTSLQYVERRKQLSIGRAIVGGTIEGILTSGLSFGAGAVLGGLSSNKMKKGQVKCLNCGHSWKL